MQVKYFPPKAKSISDYLPLHSWMASLMAQARSGFIPQTANSCAKCGRDDRHLEVHHIKPVWAYALEALVSISPKTIDDLNRVKDISYCNNNGNLMTLCTKCHTKEGKKADRKWKKYFESNYRVAFGLRNYRRMRKIVG